VLAVASIDLRKGPHYLLEAFSTARLRGAELELIGGTGSRWARALIERYTRAHANITLRQADVMTEPVSSTYGRASILVHAAVEDGYGLVVAQALASGRPVIVTDASGASELIADGVNGFVVPAGSASAIREKLELLAGDPDLLQRLSAQAPGSVAHLGYEAFREAVLAFYQKAAA
jgi:glycosyltransferase involved in cell wall biosynthesis